MTGFGVSEGPVGDVGGATLHIELRSVNGRFLELKIRQPFGPVVEHQLRRKVEAALGRGRVDLRVDLRVNVVGAPLDESDPLDGVGVTPERVAAALEATCRVSTIAKDAGVELSSFSALELLEFLSRSAPGSSPEGAREVPAGLDECVQAALSDLCDMRMREGQALTKVLFDLFATLVQQVEVLERSLEGEAARLHTVLVTRVEALLAESEKGSLDPTRVAQEVAVVVARGDVAEELARIASHVDQVREVLAAQPEVGQGKRLDFLAQELLREVSTIGAKITAHEGSAAAILAKTTIERIREQVQNVE